MMSAQLTCRVPCSHTGLSTRCMMTRDTSKSPVSVLQEVLVREGWADTIGGGRPSMLVIDFFADIL